MTRLLAAALLVIAAANVGATTLAPGDLGALSRDARTIARGTVVAVDARWSDDRHGIETLVTLEAETYLKGPLGASVQFRVPGGQLGRYRRVVIGAPKFAPGQHVIVFLGTIGPSVPHLVGFSQGVVRLTRGPSGDWMLVSPSLTTSATVLGSTDRGAPARRAVSVADFERQVRQLVEAAR